MSTLGSDSRIAHLRAIASWMTGALGSSYVRSSENVQRDAEEIVWAANEIERLNVLVATAGQLVAPIFEGSKPDLVAIAAWLRRTPDNATGSP